MAVGNAYVSQGVYSTDNVGAVDTSPPAKGGERQDLWDVVTRIDPADAPFMNNSPKGTGTAIIHDWTVQELAAVDTTAQLEGDDVAAAGTASTAADRFYNYMMIFRRDYKVSDTMDSVDHAGHAAMSIRQRTLKALELRRDVESGLMSSNIRVASGAAREASGLGTWMVNSVGGPTNFAPPTGDGSDAFTTGGAEALTLAKIDAVLELTYAEGGQPNLMYFPPSEKVKFSKLDLTASANTIAASNRFNMTAREPATYIGAVDVYLSDFGTLEAVIDRFQPVDVLYLVDNRHLAYVSLRGRNFKNEPLSKIGDSERGMVITEFTLRVNAPKAHGAVFDLV